MGFEPTVPFGTPVFKTGAINHSTTPPGLQPIHDRLLTHDAMNLRTGRIGKPTEGWFRAGSSLVQAWRNSGGGTNLSGMPRQPPGRVRRERGPLQEARYW